MKLSYFSDLHAGQKPGRLRRLLGAREVNKERVRRIVAAILEKLSPDTHVILIGGDLAESMTVEEFEFLKRVLSVLKRAGFVIVIAPGNHDYGWRGNLYESECHYRTIDLAAHLYDDFQGWPVMLDFEDWRLAVLDSTAHREKGNAFARGRCGNRQLAWLAAQLPDPRPTIVGMHHCPVSRNPFLKMSDGDELIAVCNRPHVTIVHGHLHTEKQLLANYMRPRILASGKVTETEEIRIYEIDPAEDEWNVRIL